MSNQYAEKITEALAKLDTQNPDHWTDDGLPVTRVVQMLAGEPAIKRSDLNEVAPGFSRDSVDGAGLGVDGGTVLEAATPIEPLGPSIDPVTGLTTTLAVSNPSDMPDETKAEFQAAFEDADQALVDARKATVDARTAEQKAQKARDAALIKMNAAFPPLTAAENIQQYLKHENEQRAKKFGALGVYAQSQLDQVMGARRGRHNTRPQRGQTVAR
jgi:hypothetical protein